MISVTKLLGGPEFFGDRLRYDKSSHAQKHGTRDGVGPVVVWNSTKTCNLECIHCYASAKKQKFPGEMTTEEAKEMIDDLASFKVPALLMSGGEPLVRPDILDLAEYATSKGIRITFSTNGILITEEKAKKLKEFSRRDPAKFESWAHIFEVMIDVRDSEPWPCPSKVKEHSFLPTPGGSKADPHDLAIALVGQRAGPFDDGFASSSAGSFDGLAMVDRALRAARGGRGDARYPHRTESNDLPGEHRIDPRFPPGFGPVMPGAPRVGGFGGWGWSR